MSDKSSISCDSQDEVLSMYSFLLSLASQYGIILMPLDEITAWIDPTITEYAPTFGLDPMQFATSHDAHQAYNTMTHAPGR